MREMAGIAHQAASSLNQVQAMASSSSGGSGSDAASITANDFLTLLVTEMKNQDPTANMDPNEYINQLVNVNSLQQLMSINQNLETVLGISPSSATSTSGSGQAASPSQQMARLAEKMQMSGESPASSAAGNPMGPIALNHHPVVAGNLSIPALSGSAQAVSYALSAK